MEINVGQLDRNNAKTETGEIRNFSATFTTRDGCVIKTFKDV
jgi:hypothetical protein